MCVCVCVCVGCCWVVNTEQGSGPQERKEIECSKIAVGSDSFNS